MKPALLALVAAVGLAAMAAAFVYWGAYNIAADEPHWPLTERLLETVRTRSIDARAGSLSVPGDLDDEKRVLAGAGQYAEMCEVCHLAPGVSDTPLRQGLYPRPPDFSRPRPEMDPREDFWVVKHGIKMTAMPAWGASHGDDVLWSIVAFLRKLPELDARGYKEMAAKAPRDEEMHTPSPHSDAPGHGHASQK